MKKVITGLLSIGIVASSAYLAGCSCFDGGNPPGNPPAAEADGYVSLNINPSIDLIVDQYGKVMSVNATNDDARVLLYNETGIIGATIEDAVKKITTLAKNMGYLSSDDIVGIVSEGISQEKVNAITSAITTTAQNLGLSITTDLTGGYSLYRELDEFKSKYPNNTTIQNLNISKFKLALAVSETSSTSLEVAIELDDSELIDRLNTNISKIELFMTEEFQNARDIAHSTFEQAKIFAGDIAYMYWFSQNMSNNPKESYIGSMYVLYHASAKGLDLIANTIEDNTLIKNYELSQTQIDSIKTTLNLSSEDVLKDSLGKITINSVEKYLDTYIKQNSSTDLSNVKTEIDTILDEAEIEANNSIKVARNAYLSQIESIFDKTTFSIDSLESAYEILNASDDTKAEASIISERLEAYNNLVSILKTFVDNADTILSLNEIKTIRDNLMSVANELKNTIDEKLTSEQKAQIEVIKATSLTQLSSAERALEEALETAEHNAKITIMTLKLEKLDD